jgi:hypothetical protein
LASVIFICLGLALYQLLNRVDARWATVMVVFVMVSATISFVNELNFIGALLLFRGKDVLGAIDPTQRNALGMFFLRLHGQGEIINEIFWGLWLLPLGVLFFRSGFLPRFIGVWLIIACLAWVSLSAIGLTAPGLYDTAFSWLQPAVFAEVAAAFWLVIRGAKPRIMGSSPKAQLAGLLSVWF